MIHRQHRISDVILRGLSSQPGVGSARWKSDLVDPHSLQYPVTKLLPNTKSQANESHSTSKGSSQHWQSTTHDDSGTPRFLNSIKCPAWGWPPKAFSTCRPASANFVRRFWPRSEKPQGSVCHSDSMGETTKQIGYTSGRYGSTFPIQLVPFDLQPWKTVLSGHQTIAFILSVRATTGNVVLEKTVPKGWWKSCKFQAVRSRKRWNFTMQGMSDLRIHQTRKSPTKPVQIFLCFQHIQHLSWYDMDFLDLMSNLGCTTSWWHVSTTKNTLRTGLPFA